MLNCKQASCLVSESLERKLSLRERISLKFHLMMCDACRKFKAQLVLMHKALKSVVSGVEEDDSLKLSDDAKNKIERAIDSTKK